jgi:hypothetical protein
MQRRHLLLSLLAAPAIIRTPGLLMAVRPPPEPTVYHYTVTLTTHDDGTATVGPLVRVTSLSDNPRDFLIRSRAPLKELNGVSEYTTLRLAQGHAWRPVS